MVCHLLRWSGMRSPLLLLILLAAVMGACNQSLTPKLTGAGGTGTATGGANPGTGGYGGNVASVCNTLTAEYQSALTAAGSCQVGASGQCQQIVGETLYYCSNPTYVTDSSALNMIQMIWQAAGCEPGPPPPCALGAAALNNTCVSTDGGGAGFCSYVPGTGGTGGAGGSSVDGGLSACGTLASEFASVLIGAKSCTAGAAGQCGQAVPSSLSPCSSGCTEFVTDSSVLDSIQQEWDVAGCGNVPSLCPLEACLPAASATCVPSDAGGSVCSTSYQPVSTD
jgi:hypothetical protein